MTVATVEVQLHNNPPVIARVIRCASIAGVIGFYAAPYLVGFAYTRHVIPLVLPAVSYAMAVERYVSGPDMR